ncbi:transporter [Leuconostoc litchii]|uniref:Polysaccharide biosynthesis protein n=1 Tax=Leuconostoc litchii TaxID=1981069 RepID=A0A6P2CMP4_9LACO|nr:polysaccharide biosynthesis protein [Leuconostoc litchii]TYC47298.1 polysaccharide biosynthesis protein [Leuconostoc litchii]GMA69290.1 transporter [Leuconostoc litchii]
MTNERRPRKSNDSSRVDKTNVDGKTLTADEILSLAGRHIQEKHNARSNFTRKNKNEILFQPTEEEILAIKEKNTRARQKIIKKKPNLQIPEAALLEESSIENTPNSQNSNQATLIKGSAWLSVGNMVSRILGVIYLIPWMAMLGTYATRANGLFNQGYTIYAIFLAIATFGIPAAISKVVAELSAKNDIYRSRQLTRQSMILGVLLGIVFGFILYAAAPILSNNNADVVPVLRSLAPAVAIFPLMSMIRGLFQGHQLMSISAMSQVIEQIARVAYMLVMAIIILRIDSNNWTGVVVQSTFAAFIGAIFSMIVLAWGWVKYRHILSKPISHATPHENTKTLSLVFNILKESWPFIIIGSAITLFQTVDQYSFFSIMNHFFALSKSELLEKFSLFSANPNKLIMIIVPFSTSIASTALPMLSGSKAALTYEIIQDQLKQVFKLFSLIMLPSALGMYAIAGPLYKMFYPIESSNQEGIYMLQYSTILALVFSLFMLLAFVLQALSEVRIVMKAFFIGIIIKIVLQIPLIRYFEGMGALITSVIGMFISILYMLDFLKKVYGVSFGMIGKELWQMFMASGIMAIVAYAISFTLGNLIFPTDTKFSVTMTTFIAVSVGAFLLIAMYLRMGLANELLGNKIKYVPKILRSKR